MSARIPLGDGSSWPRPVLESDDHDLTWTLTYGTPTRADLLQAASFISAYGHLLLGCTQNRRDFVVRKIRQAIADERTTP